MRANEPEAGSDPKVTSLVDITAFAPDKGESVSSLIANPAPGAPTPPILPPVDGFLFLDRESSGRRRGVASSGQPCNLCLESRGSRLGD